MPSGPFDEVLFPEGVSYGSTFGAGFNTSIIRTPNRAEQRTSLAQVAVHRYDIRETAKAPDKIAAILSFYFARRGAERGFRLKDWTDFLTSADHGALPGSVATPFDQELGVGDGVKTTFQLVKRYTNGGQSYVRNITKPRAGTVRIGLDGVEQMSGWSVNTATGLLTFTSPPGVGVIPTWGGQFDVPVRFSESADRNNPIDCSTFGTREISSLPMEEIIDGLEVASDVNHGGSYELATADNFTFDPLDGLLWSVNATASGKAGTLWDMSTGPTGWPMLVVANDGANDFDIKTHDGSTLITCQAGKVVIVWASLASGGAVTVYASEG